MSFSENTEMIEKLKETSGFFIAKTGKEMAGEFLPLWMHMLDTAGVMEKLFDDRIPAMVRNNFIDKCGSVERARGLFIISGLLHDIGKVSSAFQASVYRKLPLQFPQKFLEPRLYKGSGNNHHSRLGMVILMKEGFSQAFASVTGAHHGRTQESVLKKSERTIPAELYRSLYGDFGNEDFWNECWAGICGQCLQLVGFSSPEEIPDLGRPDLLVLTGYVSHADWAASNVCYFPLIKDQAEADPKCYPDRIERGWKSLGLPERWVCKKESSFDVLFGFSPHSFQRELVKIAQKITEPGLMIIEAPMGLGKTEAALSVMDIFSVKRQIGGVFFGLPTQATANGLLSRFTEWTARETAGTAVTFRLAHGASSLNEDYARLALATDHTSMDSDGESLMVHHWMDRSQLTLFSDFVIGTVDQALMAGLDHRYVAMKHAGLAGKGVIIDEVHSYDVYMLQYFEALLMWLGAYRVPVILLSATLPGTKRKQLLARYLEGRGVSHKELKELSLPEETPEYPSVTWTDGRNLRFCPLPYTEEHRKIEVDLEVFSELEKEEEIVFRKLTEKIGSGGCAGIIVNTVRRAQELYLYLEKNTDFQLILIHSAFTGSDRQLKEQAVIQRVGKNSFPEERDGLVVIGTQVLEQSLDVDFDYMITELAPMDLLLQRIGRLHRHHNSYRIRKNTTRKPSVTVLKPESVLEEDWKTVYSKWILHQTLQNLSDEIVLPDDIPVLVNRVYRSFSEADLTPKEQKLYEQDKIVRSNQAQKAKGHVLNDLGLSRTRYLGLNGMNSHASVSSYSSAENAVRDIDPSLEAILVRVEGKKVFSVDSEPLGPDWTLADMLKHRVRIPQIYDLDAAEAEIRMRMAKADPDFQKRMNGELFILLDNSGNFEAAGNRYTYSTETGVMKIK